MPLFPAWTGRGTGTGLLIAALAATSCSSGAKAACTKQASTVAESNCGSSLYDLLACDTGAAPPSAECSRTTLKDSYCCPGAALTAGGSTAAAKAIVAISRGNGDAGCVGGELALGRFEPPQTVANGQAVQGGTALVTCSVRPEGDELVVVASASVTGTQGSIEISGRATQTPGSLRAVFVDANGVRVERAGCAVSYPTVGGVHPGRLWASLACGGALEPAPASCPFTAEVRFENCAQ